MMIRHIMPRGCATTVIISTEEPKSPGTALMKSSMQEGCARIATSTPITKKRDRRIK
jgi:hypothetical protein